MGKTGKMALGKGLAALIEKTSVTSAQVVSSSEIETEKGDRISQVDLSRVVASGLQPRKEFVAEQLNELVDSIREHGIIQPLIVRLNGEKYEVIAGERRLRAAAKLGLAKVPVIVREASDRELLEMALIENLQREDLNPIEEANGYIRLTREFTLKQDEIAKRVGKSRASISNAMRLLDLHEEVQNHVSRGVLSVGHAKAILGVKNREQQCELANEVIRKGLTVRQTEKLVRSRLKDSETKPSKETVELTPLLQHLQDQLTRQFAAKVQINHTRSGKGKIEIEYPKIEDLNRIMELLGVDFKHLD